MRKDHQKQLINGSLNTLNLAGKSKNKIININK